MLLLTLSSVASARDHRVDVVSFRFAPAELIIQAGDSVTWHNQDGLHNVLADEGSFSSGAPSSDLWTYRYVFTQPGEYRYFCTEHGSRGGIGMAGRIRVEGETAAFRPGRFATGSWYTPALNGQGFLFEALTEPARLAVSWYTFSVDGTRPDWFVGVGSLEGAVARSPLVAARGGVFAAAPAAQQTVVGELVVTFHSCTSATASWRRDDLQQHGSLPLQRLTPVDPGCADQR